MNASAAAPEGARAPLYATVRMVRPYRVAGVISGRDEVAPLGMCQGKRCRSPSPPVVRVSVSPSPEVDEQSAIEPCGESCGGRSELRWLHSGDSMCAPPEAPLVVGAHPSAHGAAQRGDASDRSACVGSSGHVALRAELARTCTESLPSGVWHLRLRLALTPSAPTPACPLSWPRPTFPMVAAEVWNVEGAPRLLPAPRSHERPIGFSSTSVALHHRRATAASEFAPRTSPSSPLPSDLFARRITAPMGGRYPTAASAHSNGGIWCVGAWPP